MTWQTDQIEALTFDEMRLYRREYEIAIADGALKVRTEAEFIAQHTKTRSAEDAAAAKLVAKPATSKPPTIQTPET